MHRIDQAQPSTKKKLSPAKLQMLDRAVAMEMLETRQMLNAVVGIVAIDATATEASKTTGKFRLTRDDTTAALDVSLEIDGTADNGTDYTTVSDTVHFAIGAGTADVTITPVDDSEYEGDETVVLAIADSDDYDTDADASSDTVTITDNEKPTVTLTSDDTAAAEASLATGKYTITRDGPTTGALSVKLTITGTAINGTDYNTISTTATIPDGEDSVDITLTPKDDSLLEGKETAIITLATGTTYLIDATDKTATVNIADDELPSVKIVASDFSATEGSTTDTGKFTISRTGATTAIAESLVVKFAVSGTATDGTDYDTIGVTATIPAGKSSVDVTIKTKQDTDVELGETAKVTLSTDAAYTIDDTAKAATVNIKDDDKPTVSLSATDATAYEVGPSNSGKFTITRTGATTEALSVPVTITGTAIKGTDYKSIATTVTIPVGKSSAVVEVKPKDDLLLEGNETIILTLGTGLFTASTEHKTGTVTLGEDEVPTVTIVATDGKSAEPGTDKGTFTVTRDGPTTGALVVDLDIDGTADNGDDYTEIADSVTIPVGKTSATITLTPTDDTDLEGTETVTIGLAASDDYDVDSDKDSAAATITDNEKPTVSIVATDASAAEASSATGMFTLTRTGPTSEDLKVSLTIAGTATKGTDYASIDATVTIPAGASTKTITITPVDDSTLETSETVILTVAANTAYTVSTEHKTDTVTIAENDKPTVTLVATDPTMTEPTTDKATLTFTRNGPTVDALDVTYSVDDASTATSGDDYDTLTGTATIPAGKTSITVTITPKDDTDVEGSETVIVNLGTSSTYLRDADKKIGTVTLKDNDKPTISLTATDASALENNNDDDDTTDNKAIFTFARDGATTDAIDVLYTIAGTAKTGTDTTEVLTGKVTIPAGASSKTLTITTSNDSDYEGNETVILALKAAATYTVSTDHKDGTATIVDDDKPTVSIVATDGTAKEGTTDGVVLTVSRTGATTGALTVDLVTSGVAEAADFSAALPTTATIPAGKSFVTVTMLAKDDSTYEGTETLNISLAPGDDYDVDEDKGLASISVVDKQIPTVSIAASDANAAEASHATGAFTITRTTPNTDELTVTITITGSAKNGKDYAKISKTVTIAAGEDSKVITITPKTDTAIEGSETVIVTLATGTTYKIDDAHKAATVTIADEQLPGVSVEAVESSVDESDSVGARFRIWRTGATTGQTLVVKFELAGTADVSDDYAIKDEDGNDVSAGSVTIAAGDAYVDVYVIPVDNSTDNTDKTVELTVSSDAAYDVDTDHDTSTITIADDDVASSQLPKSTKTTTAKTAAKK